jgi:hypothetical protein
MRVRCKNCLGEYDKRLGYAHACPPIVNKDTEQTRLNSRNENPGEDGRMISEGSGVEEINE